MIRTALVVIGAALGAGALLDLVAQGNRLAIGILFAGIVSTVASAGWHGTKALIEHRYGTAPVADPGPGRRRAQDGGMERREPTVGAGPYRQPGPGQPPAGDAELGDTRTMPAVDEPDGVEEVPRFDAVVDVPQDVDPLARRGQWWASSGTGTTYRSDPAAAPPVAVYPYGSQWARASL